MNCKLKIRNWPERAYSKMSMNLSTFLKSLTHCSNDIKKYLYKYPLIS